MSKFVFTYVKTYVIVHTKICSFRETSFKDRIFGVRITSCRGLPAQTSGLGYLEVA